VANDACRARQGHGLRVATAAIPPSSSASPARRARSSARRCRRSGRCCSPRCSASTTRSRACCARVQVLRRQAAAAARPLRLRACCRPHGDGAAD
jgi:hypothetical protein